jgi:hypothetical protein
MITPAEMLANASATTGVGNQSEDVGNRCPFWMNITKE